MLIRYPDGSYTHGVICRLTGGILRAVVAGVEDMIEIKLIRGIWTTENGVAVTFEFPAEGSLDFFQIMHSATPHTEPTRCAAGGDCVLRRLAASGGSDPAN